MSGDKHREILLAPRANFSNDNERDRRDIEKVERDKAKIKKKRSISGFLSAAFLQCSHKMSQEKALTYVQSATSCKLSLRMKNVK